MDKTYEQWDAQRMDLVALVSATRAIRTCMNKETRSSYDSGVSENPLFSATWAMTDSAYEEERWAMRLLADFIEAFPEHYKTWATEKATL